MKCSRCGNNNTTFHYKANINGQITETHLCAECAQKAGITAEKLFGNSVFGNEFFGKSMFGNSLFGGGMLGNGFGSMFDTMFSNFFTPMTRGFFSDFNGFVMPAIGPSMVEMFVRSDEEAGKEKVTATPDAELSRRRELNALREQLNNAVKAEEYERAAELRDQIRELEKKKD
ncbi:MAG TPA: hypothetical protein GXZ65_03145 [Clostridiales bacterium]|jgi:protein arginine kinase activator|nr:hypothetical protein [Clostridiales bacterium]